MIIPFLLCRILAINLKKVEDTGTYIGLCYIIFLMVLMVPGASSPNKDRGIGNTGNYQYH